MAPADSTDPSIAPRSFPLADQRVAIAGRLVSMSHREAARLIAELGGRLQRSPSRRTTLVVLGRRGLPLLQCGDPSVDFSRFLPAQDQASRPHTVSEEEFLEQIGLADDHQQLQRRYTAEELIALTGISRAQFNVWLRSGLIAPIERFHSLAFFDFVQVSSARRLVQLTSAGVRTAHIRQSLEKLSQWLPEMEMPLLQLQVIEQHGPLAFRTHSGQLVSADGQFHLDFAGGAANVPLPSATQTAEEWFERGCEHEDREEWSEAAWAYRQSLLAGGPDADTAFNLANVLYALGQRREAIERYWQAVEIDPAFAEAWNNLGVALAAIKQCDEALAAYRKAVELDPSFAHACSNLAACLEQAGCIDEALNYWRIYLALDARGHAADYAHERLAQKA